MVPTCMVPTCMVPTCMVSTCMVPTCMIPTCMVPTCMVPTCISYVHGSYVVLCFIQCADLVTQLLWEALGHVAIIARNLFVHMIILHNYLFVSDVIHVCYPATGQTSLIKTTQNQLYVWVLWQNKQISIKYKHARTHARTHTRTQARMHARARVRRHKQPKTPSYVNHSTSLGALHSQRIDHRYTTGHRCHPMSIHSLFV